MGPLRVQRRFSVARWFLYAGAVLFLLSGFFAPLSVAALGLALWSKRDPRRAFAIVCGLQSVVVLVQVASAGLGGLASLIPLLAFYFAWASAAPAPRPALVASPYPRTGSIDIGNSWQAGEAWDEPTERPTWFLRDLVLLLAVLVLAAILSMALHSG